MTAATPPPLPADLAAGLRRLKLAAMRRVVDQGMVVLGKVIDVGLDAADQLPQLGDLFLGGRWR